MTVLVAGPFVPLSQSTSMHMSKSCIDMTATVTLLESDIVRHVGTLTAL